MNTVLSTHNLKKTAAIEEHILARIQKLEHLDDAATTVRVTLEYDETKAPGRQFGCSMRLALPGPDIFAEDAEGDMYAAIDLVVKKVEQQLRKRHSKAKARKHDAPAKSKRSSGAEEQ